MSVESYVVKGVMALDLAQTLSGLREMTAGFRGILEQIQAIRDMQGQINAKMAAGGQAFADGMAKGAASAAAAAASAEATSKAIVAAAGAQVQALDAVARAAGRAQQYGPPPLLLLTGPTTGAAPTGANYPSLPPPSVMITPPPARGFELQGAPYGPGTALVPVNQATGGYTGGYSSYDAWRAAGAPPDPNLPARWRDPAAGTGFTMGGRAGQAADEPFNEPGPVRLYDMPSRGEFYAAGYGAQTVGNAAGGLIDSSFMAAAGVDQLKGALAAQGLTKDQVDSAYAQAVKTQHDVLGTYIGQNLGLIIKLMALTQDAGAATAMLPEMARAQQVFAGLGRDGGREIGAAMQSAELRGVLFHKNAQTGKEEADLPAIASFLKNMETITAMSGGRYGPGEILQILKSGGVAASIMSDEHGFAEMMPLIQSLGAARAGTAMRAFSLQFSAGKMADASMNDLIDIGLIPENVMGQDVWRELQAKRIAHGEKPQKMPAGLPEHGILYHEKVGIGQQRLLPGAMSQADFEMINSHPEQYVLERLLPAVQAYEAKTYGKAYAGADDKTKLAYESAEMQRLASRIPGGVFDSDLIRLAPLIKRDVDAFNNARKGDAYKSVVTDNPMMQLQGFQAAVNALQVTLGNQNMAMSIATMKALTTALDGMSTTMARYPRMGTELMLIADALKILAPAIAGLMVAIPAISAFSKFAKWATPSAGGIAAASGSLVAPGLVVGASAWGLNSLLNYGSRKEADLLSGLGLTGLAAGADKMGGMSDKDLSAKYHITVNNYIDGKEVGSSAIKTIVKTADGPSAGSNDFDGRRSFTPVEH